MLEWVSRLKVGKQVKAGTYSDADNTRCRVPVPNCSSYRVILPALRRGPVHAPNVCKKRREYECDGYYR